MAAGNWIRKWRAYAWQGGVLMRAQFSVPWERVARSPVSQPTQLWPCMSGTAQQDCPWPSLSHFSCPLRAPPPSFRSLYTITSCPLSCLPSSPSHSIHHYYKSGGSSPLHGGRTMQTNVVCSPQYICITQQHCMLLHSVCHYMQYGTLHTIQKKHSTVQYSTV